MPKRILAVMLMLFTALMLFQACAKKSNPTVPDPGPAAPTNTPTNLNGYTSTPSFTPTFTYSSTPSYTPTPTNPGGTPNTPSSPTATFTNTHTYTSTFTPISTNTFTATNTPQNGIVGTLTGSGVGTVNSTYPLVAYVTDDPNLIGGSFDQNYLVNASGGSFSTGPITVGNYYFIAWRNGVGDSATYPHVGDYYQIYNGRSAVPGTAVNVPVSGPVSVSMTITSANAMPGLYGAVSYTGGGLVDSGHRLYVLGYSNNTYTAPLTLGGHADVSSSGSRYDLQSPGTTTAYALAFYDADGDGNLSLNDPYEVIGAFSGTAATNRNITVTGNNSWEAPVPNATVPYRLSGSVTYSGSLGTVSSAQPIAVVAFPDSTMNNPSAQYMGIVANGGYVLDLPANQNYYLLAIYAKGGSMNNGPSVGDPYVAYNSSCTIPPSALSVAGPTVVNLNISDSCRMPGISGVVNYMGANTVDNNHRIRFLAYTDATYTTSSGFKNDYSSSGVTYNLFVPNTATAYGLVYLDVNNNNALDAGEPYEAMGSFAPSTLSTKNILLTDANAWVAPTPNATNPYRVCGNINYTGSLGSVDIAHPLDVQVFADSNFSTNVDGHAYTSGTFGGYLVDLPSSGTYYMVAIYGAGGVTLKNGPSVGDPYKIFNVSCGTMTPTGVSVSGAVTNDFSLNDACRFVGVYGNASYGGSMGPVGSSKRFKVQAYTDGTYATKYPIGGNGEVTVNGTRYDMVTPGATSIYALAYLDVNNNGSLDVGEPFYALGAVTPSASKNIDISFDDTYLWTGFFIEGSINYTPGGVNSTNYLLAHVDTDANFQGSGGSGHDYAVETNGGSYLIPVPSAGTYYMAAVYNYNGTDMMGGGGGPPVGAPYQVDNGTCALPAGGVVVPGGGSVTKNFTFNTTCRFWGYAGTLTYTGSGTVDGSHRLFVDFDDVSMTTKYTSGQALTNGGTYNAVLLGGTSGTTTYPRAWYDANGNGNLDTGDSYLNASPALSNQGTPVFNYTFNDTNIVP